MAQNAARGLARHHRVDRGAGRPGGPQRRLARVRVQHRVGVDPHVARSGTAARIAAGVARRMNPLDLLQRRQRRLAPSEPRHRRLSTRAQHRLQPDRRFGMAGAGVVQQGHGMGVEQQRHRRRSRSREPAGYRRRALPWQGRRRRHAPATSRRRSRPAVRRPRRRPRASPRFCWLRRTRISMKMAMASTRIAVIPYCQPTKSQFPCCPSNHRQSKLGYDPEVVGSGPARAAGFRTPCGTAAPARGS